MANDLAYLAKRLAELATIVDKNGPKIVRKTVLSIGPVLVYSTPLDTSRARLNWQPAIGSLPSGVLFAYPDKPPSPDYGERTAVAAINAVANSYAGGSYIAIVNNTPYIQKLNEGWSSQAPAAFVEQSIAIGLRAVKQFRMLRNVN